VKTPDRNQTFQQGLDFKRQKRYEEAINCFQQVLKSNSEIIDADLFFNLGECYWQCGNLEPAALYLQKTLEINKYDPDAQNILHKIRSYFPYQLINLKKDGAILDANFIIHFYNKDFHHFRRFLKKACKNYNLITSRYVYAEMLQPDQNHLACSIDHLQQLLERSLIIFPVPPREINEIESNLVSKFCEVL